MKRLRDVEKPNWYKDLLRSIAHIQVKHPLLTVAALLVITLALLGGVASVRTVASLEQMMPSDIEEIKAFNDLRDNGMGQDVLAVVVSINEDSTTRGSMESVLTYEMYRYVRELQGELRLQSDVLGVHSFADVVDAAAQGPLTEESYNAMIDDPQLQPQLRRFVNNERTNTILLLTTDVAADDFRMRGLAESVQQTLEDSGHPRGVRLAVTGTPVIQQRLSEIIEHDREYTERISALFVFILVGIVFGSIAAAFVPMIAILLSVIWLYGAMGYLQLPVSTLASGVAAMVIGIGVDFSIHLRNKFEYERRKGESLEYAVEETMANTGYVLTTVTIVTVLAFLTFTIGRMPEMGRFGLLMSIGVTLAFILSVIGLPAFFILEERLAAAWRQRFPHGEKDVIIEAGTKLPLPRRSRS